MSLEHSFIIIKGKPKTLQIDKIRLGGRGLYDVKFKNSPTVFHYRYYDVVWLKDETWHDHLNTKVFIGGREQYKVQDIRSFKQDDRTHWRITFSSGYTQEYLHGSIRVVESCLGDQISRNTFDYLKRVAKINELGKDEEHGGFLSSLYEGIDFIDDEMAVAPYLNPAQYKVKRFRSSGLIFPFGCNASQEKAVTAAFENQISVIQGPPGTGKTQTILNIIANIIMQGKSVMVVSNNNSATANVLEKLKKYGLGFFVAQLGKRENKEAFVRDQPKIPAELQTWNLPIKEKLHIKTESRSVLSKLKKVFDNQEELALSRQELKSVQLEWQHFMADNHINENDYTPKHGVKSKRILKLWLQYQAYAEGDSITPQGMVGKLKERIKWSWMEFIRKYLLGIKSPFDLNHLQPTILELQSLFYIVRIQELLLRIDEIESYLNIVNGEKLSKELSSNSLILLKDALYEKYHKKKRYELTSVDEIKLHDVEFCDQYPVILSTTYSARTSIPKHIYDYIVMDEASQVSIDTGALALTCAKHAVIVGDTMQLPNVVTDDDRLKLNAIFDEFKVAKGYQCADYSFLQSVCTIISNVHQTLLREHYRCHPTIINFCNQRFYGGNLLIMTEDHGEKDVMMVIRTVPGRHVRNHYNQREIDVVKEEILPLMKDTEDVGIITPYNSQVEQFIHQIPSIETATIHKYQGREKDTIIMSVTDDVITEFSDDSNLINVAVSRAKNRFCLVVSGNEQERKGNISDLIDYIAYNNFSVAESKISSIFDYLYSQYTNERITLLTGRKRISEYDSENLTYMMLDILLKEYPEFSHLGILCHTPIRSVIRDWSLLNDDEKKYISHYSTHLDFLIINHVNKKPVMAIETDGYSFHNEETEQHHRDLMKDHILELYNLPLLRLKTNESGEKEKVIKCLRVFQKC